MDDFFFFEYYQMKLRQFFFMGRKVYITNIATTVKFRIASLFSLAYLSVQQTRLSLKQHIQYAFRNGGGRNTRRSHLQLQLWELNYIHIRISLREFSVSQAIRFRQNFEILLRPKSTTIFQVLQFYFCSRNFTIRRSSHLRSFSVCFFIQK